MATLKEIARTYALGFSVGYFSRRALTNWADNLVATLPFPHPSVIELSLGAKLHPLDILHILDEIPGVEQIGHAEELLLGLVARDLKNGTIDEKQTAFILDQIGDIPEDGHWPDMLVNSQNDGHTFKEITDRIRHHVMRFEPFADEWMENVEES